MYVIMNLESVELMLDLDGSIEFYETEEEARNVCGIYELDNVWILKMVYNHREPEAMSVEDIFKKMEADDELKKVSSEYNEGIRRKSVKRG